MIRFEHVTKSYGSAVVLEDLSFEIQEGTFTVLIGPSGCGKTTSLKMMNRLIEPDSGKISIGGQDITSQNKVELRRSIGYVIQQIGLFPNMTVAQNISVVPKLLKYDKGRCDKIVRELLALVDLPYEEYAHKYPSQMSGGQQQRIGVLRALAGSPPIVLMDEPFGALDPMSRLNLQQEIKRLQKKLGKTIVFVTHDMDEALDLADQIIFMDKGNIVQMAPPDEILEHPASEMIRRFMGKRVDQADRGPSTAGDFMVSRVFSIDKNRSIQECVQRMARYKVDTLVVTQEGGDFAGVISIDAIRKSALPRSNPVEALAETDVPVSDIHEDAKACFDKLLNSGHRYIVVLDGAKVAGIVTKTSMAEALAEALWGDEA